MSTFDKLISTHAQFLLLKEQELPIMREHLAALDEMSKTNPLFISLSIAQDQAIKHIEKEIEAGYSVLGTLKQMKEREEGGSPDDEYPENIDE